MRILAALSVVLCLGAAGAALAQDSGDDDRGFVQRFLEDKLSDAGREVRIDGFAGALSSTVRMAELSIADDSGVWLTLRDVTLAWRRAALLSGRVEIDTLSAAEIVLERPPQPERRVSVEDSAAEPFALPELPVSIDIGQLEAGSVTLGEAVLGERAELRVRGAMSLSGGQGQARLDIERLDRPDAFRLDAAYDNETRVLALDADLREAAGGLVSRLLKLPGEPALELRIAGEGPVTDYTAQVSLDTDGQRRFGGDVTLRETEDDGADAAALAFAADLGGDLAPLFQPQFRPFFGARSRLAIEGTRAPDGALSLAAFSLEAAMLSLEGALDLDPQGWPVRFALTGRLGGAGPVRLPLAGPETLVSGASLDARYDATQGDRWTADLDLAGLRRDGFALGRARLRAEGRIGRAAPRTLAARTDFDITGLAHEDPALAIALGTALAGQVTLDWQAEMPLRIAAFDIRSGGARLRGNATLRAPAEGLPVSGSARLTAPDLARFAPLAGRDLAGQAELEIRGEATLLAGAFDISLDARTRDLRSGIPRLDPLLSGQTTLAVAARRDTEGTALDSLSLRNDALTADVSGSLSPQRGALDVSAALSDVALLDARVSGPATLATRFDWQAGGDVTVESLSADLAGALITAAGRLTPDDPALPAQGRVSAQIPALSAFAKLAGLPLSGAVDLTLEGRGALGGGDFRVSAEADGTGLATGIADLDRLIAGTLAARFVGGLRDDTPDIETFRLETPAMTATATGSGAGGPVELSLRLADLGAFAPGLDGPLTASGRVLPQSPDGARLSINLDANGPGGTTARIAGEVIDFGQRLDLALSGALPLALVNRQIAPRSLQGMARYDLRLAGRPALGALSGTVETAGARVALPDLDTALEDIAATIRLTGQQAGIDMTGRLREGGQLAVRGPVGLAPPYAGDLSVTLSGTRLTDRAIYTTVANGGLTVVGPLAGGARIGGRITLERTDIRVPSGLGPAAVELPGLRHVHEPAAVRLTRARAGLLADAAGDGAGGPAYPLDIAIDAPARIFVRGRGLDAELGGNLRIAGTTRDVIPSGQVELIRGRLNILGKRIDLTEGLIDLRGALDPYLRFVAETTAGDMLVTIVIEGLASAPEITFQSQPDMPQEEVVARLIFGRGLDSISPLQAAQLASAVASLSGRGGGGGLTGRLRESFGLSNLDVNSTEEGATEVTAGAYISDNIYSEVTVDSDGREEINLNIDISRGFTAKGRADTTGDTGIGLFFEKDY